AVYNGLVLCRLKTTQTLNLRLLRLLLYLPKYSPCLLVRFLLLSTIHACLLLHALLRTNLVFRFQGSFPLPCCGWWAILGGCRLVYTPTMFGRFWSCNLNRYSSLPIPRYKAPYPF